MEARADGRDPGTGPRVRRVREAILLVIVVPALLLLAAEGVVRLLGVDTEVIRSDRFRVGVPLWAADGANVSLVRDIYRQVLDNDLPAASAEWLNLFTAAPRVHYKLKPNVRARVSNTVNRREIARGLEVLIESDSRGFRTAERPWAKPPGAYRIVFLGDSTTFGWGVEAGERFSDLVETALNAEGEGRRFEAINLGLPGYTTHHALRLLDDIALRYEPDMLILSFGANDSREVPVAVKSMLRRPAWIDGLRGTLGRSALYRLLRKTILSLHNPFDRAAGGRGGGGAEGGPREAFVTPDEYGRNLEEIVGRAVERGARVVFLGLCCPRDYLAKMTAVGGRTNSPAIDGMYVLLDELDRVQAGLAYPELARHYEDLYGRELLKERRVLYVTSDTCHPNVLGHRILAEALMRRVFRGDLIQTPWQLPAPALKSVPPMVFPHFRRSVPDDALPDRSS